MKSNPVAKHAGKYNRAVVHVDKKKNAKRGYRKHKKQTPYQTPFQQVAFGMV